MFPFFQNFFQPILLQSVHFKNSFPVSSLSNKNLRKKNHGPHVFIREKEKNTEIFKSSLKIHLNFRTKWDKQKDTGL